MEPKHTPGPWHYQERSDAYTHIVRNAEGNSIVAYAPQSTRPEAEANARLCAAAPELLEALILLEAEMVLSGNARSTDYGWKPAIEKTRAAIAKATGA